MRIVPYDRRTGLIQFQRCPRKEPEGALTRQLRKSNSDRLQVFPGIARDQLCSVRGQWSHGISKRRSYINPMDTKSRSPRSLALQERKRLAAEEGAKAMAEYAADAIAARKNMARLRALRLAQESESAAAARAPLAGKPRKQAKRAR
ncbi:MAG TPA: hypothetical protein VN130_06615 [Xanthobacteraceae bacterium]|nr:hypothetical protein [Xanthobacteraceae bacterium]